MERNEAIILSLVVLIFAIGIAIAMKSQAMAKSNPVDSKINEAIVNGQPEPEVEEPKPIQIVYSGKVTNRNVDIRHFAFEPSTIILPKGATVTWTNYDYIGESETRAWPHSVKIYTVNIKGPRLQAGESYSYTFDVPGTYMYIDSIYPKTMKGEIIVEDDPNVEMADSQITGNAILSLSNSNPMPGLIAITIMISISVGFFLGFKSGRRF